MSVVPSEPLDALNQDIKTKGYVDREHLLTFLTLIPTNEAPVIIREVQDWLGWLHANEEFATVTFPPGDIDAIVSDLDSYGRVQPLTLQQFKQSSVKAPPQVS